MQGNWLKKPSGSGVIIFVHGVLSDGESCWLHENGSYWPRIAGDDPALGEFGVYVFTYNTGFFSGSYRISDIVDALRTHLRLDGVLKNNNLIFVAHSMGGIVVRKYLVERVLDFYQQDKEVGLFLIASPSLGSSYADWLRPLAELFGHRQAEVLKFVRNNQWLLDLDKEFTNLKEGNNLSLRGKELIEDEFVILRGIFGRQVVEPFNGAKYFPDPYKVPQSNHFSIAKPESPEAIQHKLLREFVTSNDENVDILSKESRRDPNRGGMPSLGIGSNGSLVRMVQFRLQIHPDGVFGPETESAVVQFQRDNGLIADGVVGPQTWDAFPVFGVGSAGSTVALIQRRLGVDTDGRYGPATERAVIKFQRQNALLDDGLVGMETLRALGLSRAFDQVELRGGREREYVESAQKMTSDLESLHRSISTLVFLLEHVGGIPQDNPTIFDIAKTRRSIIESLSISKFYWEMEIVEKIEQILSITQSINMTMDELSNVNAFIQLKIEEITKLFRKSARVR